MSSPPDLFVNPHWGTPGIVVLPASGFRRASAAIQAWPEYAPTTLHDRPGLAASLRVGTLRIKDESARFGLGSLKALGGGYAVATAAAGARARGMSAITVACATDGNHGRAVAWGARREGVRCVIFVHERMSESRISAIAAYGAEIRRVPGTWDDAVRACSAAAGSEHWFEVSDTSWPGYVTVPVDVMQGYRLMADEAATQWDGAPPSHVFIQAGVGAVATAVSVQMRARYSPTPRLVVVESDRAACLLASARAGEIRAAGGDLDTLMTGLARGQPSLLAWTELQRAAFAFMIVPDPLAVEAMRRLARCGIVSGQSGAAGFAGLLAIAVDDAARAAFGLDATSRVLLFSTEGATDPDQYQRFVTDWGS